LVLLFWMSLLAGPKYFVIIIPGWIVIFWTMTLFVLPRLRLPEENGEIPLYEERFSPYWALNRGVAKTGWKAVAPIRTSFYEDFFVVHSLTLKKIHYTEVLSISFTKNLFSNPMTIHLANGKSLILCPKNSEKIQSLLNKDVKKQKTI